ncbi:unnamed protein product [Strongylus vulgaris]|uniref:Uncharacterized protein n=1 Tax=Strongylus vulgaris TaxID=40348 RepID=A0A3P7JYN9_STRVU|nr:unnamed protein product [Strongylus vulgaris]
MYWFLCFVIFTRYGKVDANFGFWQIYGTTATPQTPRTKPPITLPLTSMPPQQTQLPVTRDLPYSVDNPVGTHDESDKCICICEPTASTSRNTPASSSTATNAASPSSAATPPIDTTNGPPTTIGVPTGETLSSGSPASITIPPGTIVVDGSLTGTPTVTTIPPEGPSTVGPTATTTIPTEGASTNPPGGNCSNLISPLQ